MEGQATSAGQRQRRVSGLRFRCSGLTVTDQDTEKSGRVITGCRVEGIVCRGLRACWGSTIDEWARDCLFNSWELRLIATGNHPDLSFC
ncbi:hypothetical protein Dimus_001050 [Dionaea muscipula]